MLCFKKRKYVYSLFAAPILFHKISFISPTASQGGEKEPKRSLGGAANKVRQYTKLYYLKQSCLIIHKRFNKNKLYKEMSVWNCMEESNWHHQPKVIEKTTEGQCKYCGKHVKALEAHMHDKHKHEMKLEEDRCCH